MSVLYEFDPDTPVAEVPSPCVGVCKMDTEKAWCAGCFRTLDELRDWSRTDSAQRLEVWRRVKQRMFEA